MKKIRRLHKGISQGIVWIVTVCFTTLLYANPVVNNVAAGNVSINQTPNNTVVNQTSQKAIINWNSFNIGANESTHFQQPTGGMTLNRISPMQGASQIYGRLTATGQIILVNPAGIHFGPSAYVNVGGLIATTNNITDNNFLNGVYQFDKVNGYSGSIINQGTIIAANHGLVALVGSNVSNEGHVQANLGKVVLASGDAFTMSFAGNDLIHFNVTKGSSTAGSGVRNTGSLIANGGSIMVSAKAAQGVLDNVINMQGIAQARSVAEVNGEIIISGDKDAGLVRLAANVDTSGKAKGEKGGDITITGRNILIDQGSNLDASGDLGGGDIHIGGNYKGQGPLPNSNAVVIAPDTLLASNALTRGDGGSIIVWSDYVTKAFGKIQARGGAEAGNGGFVETSSKAFLNVNGARVDLSAPYGAIGTWLLDPYDVTISVNPTNLGTFDGGSPDNIFTPNGSGSNVNNTDIQTNLATANVIITTTGAALENGDITVDAPISWAQNTILTLLADGNIIINNDITGTHADSGFVATAGLAGNIQLNSANIEAGRVTFNNNVVLGADVSMTANATSGTGIGFVGTVNSDGTARALNIDTSAGSDTIFYDNVGDSSALSSITTTAGGRVVFGNNTGIDKTVTTTLGQTYANNVMLDDNTTFSSTTNGDLDFQIILSFSPGSRNNFSVSTGGDIYTNSLYIIGRELGDIVLTSSGRTYLNGTTLVGASFIANGGGITELNGGISTDGINGIQLNNNVELNSDVNLVASYAFAFGGTVNSATATPRSLTLNFVQNPTITFSGEIGTTQPLSTLTVTPFVDGQTATLLMNGGTITTTGAQLYDTGLSVILGANTTLNTNDSNVTFNGSIDRDAGGARTLTIDTINLGGSGNITLSDVGTGVNGALGAMSLLTSGIATSIILNGVINADSLTTSPAFGVLRINGGSITTTGIQNYQTDNVFLGADTTLTTTNSNVSFSGSLNSDSGADQRDLTITTGSGDISLNNATGLSFRLGDVALNSSGNTNIFSTFFDADTLTTDAGGTTNVSSSIMTYAAGGQTYNDAVVLAFNSSFHTDIASPITFNSTINGARTFTVFNDGTTTFNGIVGGSTPLTSLTINGGTLLNAASINTTNAQTYNGDVTVNNIPTAFIASGDITFNNNLTNTDTTTINNIGNSEVVGSILGGGDLIKTGSSILTLSNANTVGEITVNNGTLNVTHASALGSDTAGTTIADGATLIIDNVTIASEPITLTGGSSLLGQQTAVVNSPITLVAGGGGVDFDADLGGSLTIGGAINGAVSLLLNSNGLGGTLTMANNIGNITPVNSITAYSDLVLGNSLTPITISSTGAHWHIGSLSLAGDVSISTTDTILIAAAIDGAANLSFTGNNTQLSNADLGSITPLTSLTVTGPVEIANPTTIVTTSHQTFNNSLGIGGDATLTSTGGDLIFNGLNQDGFSNHVATFSGNNVYFNDTVNLTQPSTLSVTASNDIYVNTPTMSTGGDQSYTAANLVLGSNTTFTAPNLTFNTAINADSAAANRTLDLAYTGNLIFGGNIGNIAALGGLTATPTGGTGINFNNVTTVSTSGSQTYNDDVIVNNTAIAFTSTGADVTFNNDLTNGGTTTISNATASNVTGAILGGGNFVKAGAGTLTLNSANTVAGVTINGGTLTLGVNNALPTTTTVSLANVAGAILDLNNFDVTLASLSGGGTTGGNVSLGLGTLTTGDATDTTFAGVMSGTGGLIKQGSGAFTLSGANTYTGLTTINTGTLSANHATALGTAASGTTVNSGAVLQINNANVGEPVTINNGATLQGTGANSQLSGNVTLALGGTQTFESLSGATFTLSGLIDGNGSLTLNGPGNFVLASSLGSVVPLASITTNANTALTLGSAPITIDTTLNQSYSSDITLASSVIMTAGDSIALNRIDGGFDLELVSPTGVFLLGEVGFNTALASLTSNNLATTQVTRGVRTTGNQTYGPLYSDFTGDFISTGGTISLGTINISEDMSFTANIVDFRNNISNLDNLTAIANTINIDSTSISADNAINLTGDLILNNNLTLSAPTLNLIGDINADAAASNRTLALDYTGSVLVNGDIGNTEALFTLTATPSGGASTGMSFGANSSSITTTSDQTYNDDVSFSNNPIAFNSGGVIAFNNNLTGSNSITINATGSSSIAGILSGSASLIKAGAGTMTLSGANTYTGTTSVNTGTLQVNHASALGSAAAGTSVADGATLAINNVTIASEPLTLTGGATLLGMQTAVVNSPITLVAGGGGVSLDASAGGSLTVGGTINGAVALLLNTAGLGGTLTLTNNIGNTTPVASITGASNLTLGNLTPMTLSSTGNQTYNNDVAINNIAATFASTGGDIIFNNNLTNASTTTINNAGSASTVVGTILGGGNLIKAGAGTLTLGNANTIGTTTINGGAIQMNVAAALGANPNVTINNAQLILNGVDITGAALAFNNGTLRGIGTASYTGTITPTTGSSNILAANAGGVLTVNSDINGASDLTLQGPGQVIINGNIGNTTPLSSFTAAANSTIDGSVSTSGNQTFNGAYNLTADRTLTSGGTITFGGAINGNQNLVLSANNLIFGGSIGAGTPLASLNVTGDATFNGNSINTIGNQTFNGVLALGSDTAFNISGTNTGSTYTFNYADGITGNRNVQLNAANTNDTYNFNVGGTLGLNSLAINGSNAGTNNLTMSSTAQIISITSADAGALAATGLSSGSFNNIQNLSGGSGNDEFFFNGGTLSGNINGGGGSNRITGDSVDNQFNITGNNSGTVTGLGGSFANIQNLTGGTQNNTFTFSDNARLGGSINGGSLTTKNLIDYQAWSNPVLVALSATNDGITSDSGGTINGFTNITNLVLNPAVNNTLQLPNKSNTLVISGAREGHVNDPIFFNGFTTFNSISGSDTVIFNSSVAYGSGSVVINGVTMYFSNFSFNLPQDPTFIPTFDVASIIQQPETNSQDEADTASSPEPAWITLNSQVSTNIDQLFDQVGQEYANELGRLKINPYCLAAN